MMPLPINQQVTFLYTQDLSASVAFYENVLHLSLVLDQGTCRIYQVVGEAFIGICQRDGLVHDLAEANRVIFTLVTPDVDGWYAYLQAQGIHFEKPPQYNPKFNIYHCFLRDPGGYLIEIQRFLDPAWPGSK
ncbi:MAG: VOC family protein [Anaerolineaceae bacterium]|nr:VOC family protein [Anaerolineaceae bacterium]